MRSVLLAVLLCTGMTGFAQFNFSCARDTTITACGTTCITLKAVIPDLYSGSGSYGLINGNAPSGNCYRTPAVLPNGPGTTANLTTDDVYTPLVNLGFTFPFFGTPYNRIVISTNGVISFDATRASAFSHYSILNSGGSLSASTGTPQDLPSALYDRAIIMGPYHDINPAVTTSPNRRIQYSVVGNAPYRKFVLSFYKVPHFDCNNLFENTHQIILNESTGIVEVLIYSREICSSWNQGRAMIGMQDFNRTQSVMVPGRRASDAPWAVTSNNNQTQPMEAYSFIPTAPTAAIGNAVQLFKRVQLYDLNGNLVATGTVAPGSRGTLEASFPNICSPLGTTSYVVRSFYEKIDDPTSEIFGQDTIRVTRNGGTLSATLAAQPTLCDGASGSLTATVTTGTAPYTYALNNSATPQNSNVFSGLAAGAYSVTVRDAQGCSAVLNGTITLQNNLTLQVAPADTALCSGRSFVPRVQSNAASYSWTPAAGLSATNVQAPTITPAASTTYTVTGTLGACTTQQTLRVNLSPSPTVNAGADQSIIAGDMVQLSGTASQGTYLWSPAAGLNAVNVLDPVASPQVTTTYTLSVTNPQGCSSTDDVVVTVVPYCVKPMEAFSPNGDGMNDLWLVTNGNCLRSAKVEVFNRYGAKVFESQDYKNNWNGTYNGKPVADGTYYFIISYQLINGKTVFQRGNVAILR